MSLGKTTITHPSYKQRTSYHGMLVGGSALLASALLVIGNSATKDVIAQRQAEDVQQMLGEVIPTTLHDNDLLQDKFQLDGKEIFQARLDGKVNAVAYQVAEPGYSGIITLIMALNRHGELLGVRVVSHTETPGLGDKMETARSDWIHSFNGMVFTGDNETQWAVKKDGGRFDQFTGATITPRAIINAVKDGMRFFQLHKQRLMTYDPGPSAATREADDHG